MKLYRPLFALALMAQPLLGQVPVPGAPPSTTPEVSQEIRDFVANGNPGAQANAPTNTPAARTAPAVPGRQPVTLPTPNSRPRPTARQLPPGFPVPGTPGATTAQPAGTATQPTAVPPVAGQVAPQPAESSANTPTAPGLDPNEVINDDALNLSGGATLDQLTDIYSELTGRIVLKSGGLTSPPNIELKIPKGSLTRREMIQAIDTYLSLNGLTTVLMGDKFVLLVNNADAPQQGPAANDVPYEDLPEASQFTSKVVHLKHIKPTELQPILAAILKTQGSSFIAVDSTQTLLLRDYAINIKRAMELIKDIDVAVPVEYETELIPIKYALASDIAQVLGGLTTGGSVTAVGSSSAGGFGGGGGGFGAGSGLGASGGLGTTGGLGNSRGVNNRFGTQQNRSGISAGFGSSASGRSAFQNRLNQLVNNVSGGGGGQGDVQVLGETKIIADERTNSLLVFANRQDMETIKDIVGKMDVVLAQVLIDSIILDVSLGHSENLGISAARTDQKGNNQFANIMNNGQGLLNFATNSTVSQIAGSSPNGFSWFGQFDDNFAIALNAAAQQNRVRVLSRPSVQTSHAVPASLFVGETRPYITGTYNYGYGTGPSSQYQQLQIGIELDVLPLINPEGLVVMDISQSVQQVAGSVTIDGNSVPITQDQRANAKVAVKDRDTVILGGFIQNNVSQSDSGVPVLKDIPLLGNLFKAKNSDNTRRELVVLIRPTVLETPADAANMVTHRKDVTPNVKKAEVDFELEEQRQLQKANEQIMKERLGLPDRGRE